MPGASVMPNIWSEAEAPTLPKRFTKRYNEADMIKNQKKTAISRLGQCGRILSQQFMPPVFSLAVLLLFTSAALAQLTTADILGLSLIHI